MEVLVCIKQVPGTTEVKIDEDTGVLKRDGVESKMNPYDLYAVETALKIKERNGATVNVISMGPPQAAKIVKEAYMMGVDGGALLTDRRFAGADVLATSYTLSQGVKKLGSPDLIICGKMTTDGDTAQVGPELAEFLGIPHASNVLRINSIGESSIIVESDMADAIEVLEIQYPCLISVDKGIFQPRLPSFRLKLATQYRDIPCIGLDDLEDKNEDNYGLNGSPTQVKRVFPPQANINHEIWEGTRSKLADRIFNKLKKLKFV